MATKNSITKSTAKKSIFVKKMIFLFYFFMLAMAAAANARVDYIDMDKLAVIAVPLHIIELVLSLFICFMALKFFRITKPLNLFMFIYVAIGFFIINSSLYILFYLTRHKFNTSFANVYLGSRITLIGLTLSFVFFFYNWNKVMRKSNVKNK